MALCKRKFWRARPQKKPCVRLWEQAVPPQEGRKTMVRYTAMKTPDGRKRKLPVWKSSACPRISGFTDALLHKTTIHAWASDHPQLRGGQVVKLQREFEQFEAAVKRYLLEATSPYQQQAEQLTAKLNDSEGSGKRRAQRTLCELRQQIAFEYKLAEALLQEGCAKANRSLIKYGKAAFFRVVQEEIPTIQRQFYPLDELKGREEE